MSTEAHNDDEPVERDDCEDWSGCTFCGEMGTVDKCQICNHSFCKHCWDHSMLGEIPCIDQIEEQEATE